MIMVPGSTRCVAFPEALFAVGADAVALVRSMLTRSRLRPSGWSGLQRTKGSAGSPPRADGFS
jgi:hypothetical protein